MVNHTMSREEEIKKFRKRLFQKVKSMTQAQFEVMMDGLFVEYYYICNRHYQEAMDATLPPRYKKAVSEKQIEIKELWDGIY